MKRILAVCFFITFFLSANAQKILSETEINRIILETLSSSKQNLSSLKDSVDFYGFAIELKVSKHKKMTKVNEIFLNDSIGYRIYSDFDFLKKINYTNILKERKVANIVIPVGILIAYVNNPVSSTPMLKAEELMPKIVKMFNYNYKLPEKRTSDFIYLNAVMCICSTKVYD